MIFLILSVVLSISVQHVLKEKYLPVKMGERLRWFFYCARMSNPEHVVLPIFPLFGLGLQYSASSSEGVACISSLYFAQASDVEIHFAVPVLGKVTGFPQLLVWLVH